MKPNKLLYFFSLLFALTVFSSCDKDDSEPTKTDILTSHEWKGSRVLVAGLDVSDRPEIKDMLLDIKTLRLNFNRNGSYTATYTDKSGPRTTTGAWQFTNNETKLAFDLLGEMEIKNFTSSNLDMIKVAQNGSLTYNAEVQLIK
ncbi:hypothetical protein [Pontibacter vulgaris]|uniref:hypothetical protein n=1 Tax=Pontibacter vulgaris TaxID=2905679 RepID=UPI001FA6D769|nr:hypothetical protein [Pontibacter vulgaris]